MTVSVALKDLKLHVRILNGPAWHTELELLKSISGRKFLKPLNVWELEWYQAPDLYAKFGETRIVAPAEVRQLAVPPVRRDISKLDPILEALSFSRNLKAYQEKYVRTAREANHILCAFEQGCVDGAAVLNVSRAGRSFKMTLEQLFQKFNGHEGKWNQDIPTYVRALAEDRFKLHSIKSVVYSGDKPTVKVSIEGDYTITCTPDHLIGGPGGRWTEAGKLYIGQQVLTNGVLACRTCGKNSSKITTYKRSPFVGNCSNCVRGTLSARTRPSGGRYIDSDGYVLLTGFQGHPKAQGRGHLYEHIKVLEDAGIEVPEGFHIHHKNEIKSDNRLSNLKVLSPSDHHKEHEKYLHFDGKNGKHGSELVLMPRLRKVLAVENVGVMPVYDITMDDPWHNFVANGVVVHNCGKTVASLERVKVLGGKRLLIVCPKVVCTNWRSEARAVLEQEAVIYLGTKPQRAKRAREIQSLVICTYETMAELAGLIVSGAVAPFDQLIFDESHLLSNPSSVRFKAAQGLVRAQPEAGIQCLSGTPIQHRIRNLWGSLHILDPYFAGSYEEFRDLYEEPVRFMYRNMQNADGSWSRKQIAIAWRTKNLDQLKKRLESICYRVKREDVTDFRDAMEMITVDLTLGQRRVYEQIRSKILVDLGNRELSLRHVPVRLLRLLQASEGLFNFGPEREDSGKLEYLRETLGNTEEKVIVWSRFRPITEILGREFADRAVVYNGARNDDYKTYAKWAFNGVDSAEDRLIFQRIKDRQKLLLEPGEAQFFLGTIDMRSSLGMNLHNECSRQIFTSFSWMGAANMQAADRLRRIGQRSSVVRTEFLVSENTFEARALSMVMSNFQTTVEALDGNERISFRQMQEIISVLREGI